MWWDQRHDVKSPVKDVNCSFDETSCSSVNLSETILSDCFLPPATQSPHHTELLCQPAELHDDRALPELSSMATVLPDVYSLVPPDLQLYEDEEKTATVTAIGSEVTAALSYASSTDAQSVSPLTSTDEVSSSEDSSSSDHTGATFNVIANLLSRMQRVAPADRFSPNLSRKMMKKKRRKFERKELHPDLITMWRNADEICAPPVSRARHASPASPYPRVDWTRVNQRNLANLPKPQYYPVHGCAQDPTFYEPRKSPCPLGNPLRSLYDEAGAIPFGSELGFRTQAGVIAPGSHGELVSGYTWSPDYQDWVLMATIPRDKQTVSKKFKKNKWPR